MSNAGAEGPSEAGARLGDGSDSMSYRERSLRRVAISIVIVVTLLLANGIFPIGHSANTTWARLTAGTVNHRSSVPLLFAFYLPLSHTPVPVDVAELHSVGEVARAAVVELALPAKLGRAVTAADVSLFVISRDEAVRLMANDSRVVSIAAKGAMLRALDYFDVNALLEGSCLLVELKPFSARGGNTTTTTTTSESSSASSGDFKVTNPSILPPLPISQARGFQGATLMIVYSTPKNLVTLPHLRRWYSPHFKRIVVYCTKDTPETTDSAAADSARALLSALSASPSLVDGVVFTYAGGAHAHFPYSHYIHFLGSELASGTSGEDGLFAIMADVLINTRLLRDLSSAHTIFPYLISHPNDAENVGLSDSSAWGWWAEPVGRPAIKAVEHDAGLGSIVKPGEKINFVAGYADFFYVPRSKITSFLRDCFEVFYRNRVYLEIGTPSVLYWCVTRDFSAWPYLHEADGCSGHSRPCKYLVMWSDTDRIYRPNGIEEAFETNLIVHPVNLRDHPEIISRIDSVLQRA